MQTVVEEMAPSSPVADFYAKGNDTAITTTIYAFTHKLSLSNIMTGLYNLCPG